MFVKLATVDVHRPKCTGDIIRFSLLPRERQPLRDAYD